MRKLRLRKRTGVGSETQSRYLSSNSFARRLIFLFGETEKESFCSFQKKKRKEKELAAEWNCNKAPGQPEEVSEILYSLNSCGLRGHAISSAEGELKQSD